MCRNNTIKGQGRRERARPGGNEKDLLAPGTSRLAEQRQEGLGSDGGTQDVGVVDASVLLTMDPGAVEIPVFKIKTSRRPNLPSRTLAAVLMESAESTLI